MTLGQVGVRLRKERQRRQLSMYRLAVLAGVHPNSVLLAERGAASIATIKRIATALGGIRPSPR